MKTVCLDKGFLSETVREDLGFWEFSEGGWTAEGLLWWAKGLFEKKVICDMRILWPAWWILREKKSHLLKS